MNIMLVLWFFVCFRVLIGGGQGNREDGREEEKGYEGQVETE